MTKAHALEKKLEKNNFLPEFPCNWYVHDAKVRLFKKMLQNSNKWADLRSTPGLSKEF
jgi:hypothetical protein